MQRPITRQPAPREFARRFNEIDQRASLLISGICGVFAALAISALALAALTEVLP